MSFEFALRSSRRQAAAALDNGKKIKLSLDVHSDGLVVASLLRDLFQ